jgi:hypothetical protein
MKILSFICVCMGLALLAGCATPEARIKRNPEIFARLSAQDQQLIREGKVALGFTKEMVELALGRADRVYTRTDASGTSESWSYTTFEGPDGMILYRGFYHRNYCWGDPFYPYYLSVPSRKEREYFKVIFTADRVSAIEQQS